MPASNTHEGLRSVETDCSIDLFLELEIVSGLNEDDRIVAHPDTTMRDGDEVIVLEE